MTPPPPPWRPYGQSPPTSDGTARGRAKREVEILGLVETSVLRPAVAEDVDKLAELRAVVMRPDLERLGRYDEHRVRQRLRDSFSTEYTSVIEIAGELAGCIT